MILSGYERTLAGRHDAGIADPDEADEARELAGLRTAHDQAAPDLTI